MNRVVWITGASRGIGASMARLFASKGDLVLINYHNSRQDAQMLLEEIEAAGGQGRLLYGDVSCSEDVARMADEIHQNGLVVDVLIHNAGISQQKQFQDLTDQDWHSMIGIHLDGAFYTARAVLPDMIRRHEGQILFVSSMWGISGGSCEVHYSAVKAGLIGLTKALAKEVGLSGIRVNCLAPGVIATQMNQMHSPETLQELADETPLGRIGKPEEIADAAYFLTSPQASFITGQTLSVDGGIVL